MHQITQFIQNRRYLIALSGLIAVYLCNAFIDIMDIDAAQYAAISREMAETGSYLEVYLRGQDYLDKPPLLFWLASLSFNLFGISNFTYKLPAILVLILGLYSTYRFAQIWYSRRVACYAALMLGSTTAYFLMTNDVRTDGLLTGFAIFAIWQMSVFIRKNTWLNLALASLGAACAMMAKGPIALIIIGSAVGTDLLLKRDWRAILKWQWLVFAAMVLLLLGPMCYGLYTQFDLHPEKEVYGLSGPSGIAFFFWTQSFGRITGDIYWSNNSGYFFFLHSILWDLQPWVFIFIPALFIRVRDIVRSRFRLSSAEEGITLAGFVLPFLALSLSNYKLPHYIFPLFPLAVIITAQFIEQQGERSIRSAKLIATLQFGLMHVLFLAIGIHFLFFFEPDHIVQVAIPLACYALAWIAFFKAKDYLDKIMLPTVVTMIAFGAVMGLHFYPSLLQYQGPTHIARVLQTEYPGEPVFHFPSERIPYSLDFYSRRTIKTIPGNDCKSLPTGSLVYVNERHRQAFLDQCAGTDIVVLDKQPDFRITKLNLKFLDRRSRESRIDQVYLLRIE